MNNCKRFFALVLCAVMLLSNMMVSTPTASAATASAYVGSCTAYPANLIVKTTVDTTLMSHPCGAVTDSSSVATHIIPKDTVLCVTGLYRNTVGEYWYEVDRYGSVAYIQGTETALLSHLTGDVTVSGVVAPASLAEGDSFPIGGTVSSDLNDLGEITVSVYFGDDLTIAPVLTASDDAVNNSYTLESSAIDYALPFNALDTGIYTYVIEADVISYYVAEDGTLAKSVKDLVVERQRLIVTDYTNPNKIRGYGVDVSVWNGDIDWAVMATEVDFAILRASFEYTKDARFDEYAQGCVDNDIPFGVYVYSYAESVAEAVAEAEAVLKFVKPYDMELPIYFDAEDQCIAVLGGAKIREITQAFIEVIREAGYECGIYTSQSWFNGYYTTPYFDSVPKWLAQIDGYYGGYTNSYAGGCHIWQFDWEGRLDGDAAYSTDQNYYYDLLPGQTADTSYRASCTAYTSNLMVTTNSSVTVMKYPCNASTNSTSTSVKNVAAGTELHVTRLYRNTAGEYWYEVDGGYIPASKATVTELLYDDMGIYNPDMGDNIAVGSYYYIKGILSATSHTFSTVHARIYNGEKVTGSAVVSSQFSPENKKEYSLYYSKVDNGLAFDRLSAGYHTYEISADVKNYYVSNGSLSCKEANVVLYTQPFTVGGTGHSHTNVSKGAVEATCTSNGISATTYCSECGKIASGGQVTPMLGHNYAITTIPGDCQNHESQYRVCKNCGDESYAYAEDMYTDWTDVKPDVDEKLIQTKTQYRSATVQTTTSTSATLAGYTLLGTTWDNGTPGTVVYAPNIRNTGFAASSSLYSQYNKSKMSASETENQKVVINSDAHTGYLYYHWCYANSYYSVESTSGYYTTFHAYYDTTDPSTYTCDTSDMSYKTSHSGCSNSLWYFVTDVYTQNYTTFNKLYIHGKAGAWSAWGDTPIAGSDSLMVEERTLYRYVDAPYGDHSYVNGVCTVCGDRQTEIPTEPSTPAEVDYYLIGYINGADYGCEDDYQNMGQYKFVDGQLTATFTQDSYVFLKTTDNGAWFMTKTYVTGNSGTFYNTKDGATEKMLVPGGVEVTFTLVENADGTLNLSYTTKAQSNAKLAGKSFSLSFEDEILVNFYFTVENVGADAELGMLVFHTNPGEANVAVADEQYTDLTYIPAAGCYLSTTDGIAAKEMGDARYYCAYAKLSDGTYAYSPLYEYSPKKYAMSRLANSDNAEMKALCVALLNYGAEAQKYFDYKADDLMNKDLTSEQRALVVSYSADLFRGVVKAEDSKITNFTKTDTGFTGASVSVSFEGAFSINYYFAADCVPDGDIVMYYWSAADYNNASQLSVANATGKIIMQKQPNGYYWAQLDGIAAKQLDDTYYVSAVYTSDLQRCCTGVVAYSLSKYCMNNAAGTSAMKDLAAFTAVYGYHAKAYFATVN